MVAATSIILGFYAGIFISTIGDDSEGTWMVARGAVLILPLVGVAVFVDWRWLIVMVTYVFGFHSGYTAFDSLGDSVGTMIHGFSAVLTIPSAWLTGSELHVYLPTANTVFQTRLELLWYYDVTLLSVSVTAILRHQWKSSKKLNKSAHPTAGNVPI